MIGLRGDLYSLELSRVEIEMLSPMTGDKFTSLGMTMNDIDDLERQYRQIPLAISKSERSRIHEQIQLLQREMQSWG